MRLPFRRKKKTSLPDDLGTCAAVGLLPSPPSPAVARLVGQVPPGVLQRIFAFVCPHSRDQSYETCEDSANDAGCMLCDLRDLSHCAQVNRRWRASAITVLYHSVRIDPVHYCQLEASLADKRKKTSRFDCNGIPEDPALARLRLFRRTVRDDPTRIGKLVQFLKTPYMIRESCHVELAQTIAVLPNLQYVDLPEGMFCDEANHATLRLEVQVRCPGLRKMAYARGAERSFTALASGQVWPRLEVLALDRLDVDPRVLRAVLACLTRLRALKVVATLSFSDEVMASDDGLPPLPALEELVLKDTPRMTTAGLAEYLSWYETQKALSVLTLKDTGVQPWDLQVILAKAPSLRTLAIQAKVSEPFPSGLTPPPLASMKLRTLRFEISATPGAGPYATSGYYAHLAAAVLSGSLPRLRRLYVHDETFPDKLSGLTPPKAMFSGGRGRPGSSSSNTSPPSLRVHSSLLSPLPSPRQLAAGAGSPQRFSSNNPFAQRAAPDPPTQTLEVFTKSDELGEWNFARVDSLVGAGEGAAASWQGPASGYGLAGDVAGQGWDRGEARRSVLIGDGTGGFLAVPGGDGAQTSRELLSPAPRVLGESRRPHSSGGEPATCRSVWG